MKREIRDEKEKWYEKTKSMKTLYFDKNLSYDKVQKIREEQAKIYNKWKFYSNLLKAEDKIKCKQ